MKMTPREIAQKIVDDAHTRFICIKPMYDSVDLGEALIKNLLKEREEELARADDDGMAQHD